MSHSAQEPTHSLLGLHPNGREEGPPRGQTNRRHRVARNPHPAAHQAAHPSNRPAQKVRVICL